MGKKKKALIIIGAIILIIVGIVLGIILNGHYFPSKKDIKDYENNDWMGFLKDETLLTEAVIPGSHDAGAFNMSWLGRTQGYSVEEQLKMGARYFDLRVNKTEDGFFTYHSILNGEDFEGVLRALKNFLKDNETETLILDFQHFKGGAEEYVVQVLEERFFSQGLAVKNDTDLSDLEFVSKLKLSSVRGKAVVLFGHNEQICEKYNWIFPRNDDECTKTEQCLNSLYISEYHQMKSEPYIKTALPFYYQNIKNKINEEGFKGLFVLQGQLTDGKLIFGPFSKEKKHDKNMSEYISRIKSDEERLKLTNVIMRDFLTFDKCENIILLNFYKDNVKEEFKSAFLEKFQ